MCVLEGEKVRGRFGLCCPGPSLAYHLLLNFSFSLNSEPRWLDLYLWLGWPPPGTTSHRQLLKARR